MTWHDQGLFFTLVLNAISLCILVPLAAYCLRSHRLSTARVYRPNHTKEPSADCIQAHQIANRCTEEERDALLLEGPIVGVSGSVDPDARSSTFTLPCFSRMLSVGETDWEEDPPDAPLRANPQSDLLLAFIKMCLLIFLIAPLLSTAWIVVMSATDDYVSANNIATDPVDCAGNNNEENDCKGTIWCDWVFTNETAGQGICFPVKTNGLFDLSIQNITPKNFRNWLVGIFAVLFSLMYAVVVVCFTNSISQYGKRVWTRQLLHAPGYRAVLVKGLTVPDREKEGAVEKAEEEALPLFSVDNFKAAFLTPKTYFGETDGETIHLGHSLFGLVGGEKDIGAKDTALFAACASPDVPSAAVVDIVFDKEIPADLASLYNDYKAARNALEDAISAERVYHRELKSDRAKAYASLRAEGVEFEEETEVPPLMGRVLPLICCEVPIVEFRREKLKETVAELNAEIGKIPEMDLTGSAFVLFSDSQAAFEFKELFNMKFGGAFSRAAATMAGNYADIETTNLSRGKHITFAMSIAFTTAFILLVFLWSIPVGFLGSLESLASLPGIGPAFGSLVREIPSTILGILTAYLPVIVLAIFNIVLPMIIRFFVVFGGSRTASETENGIMVQMYIFLVMTGVVIQAALQGGLFQLAGVISNPTKDAVFALIVGIVSPQGGYWYAQVIGAGCLSMWLMSLQLGPIIVSKILGKRASTQRDYDGLFIHLPQRFDLALPVVLTFASIGMFFHVTVPFLTFFVGIYFFNAYFVWRGVLFDNFRPTHSPCESVTSFGVLSSCMRIMTVLYLIASSGSVLVLVMKKHYGGMAFAIVALTIGALVFIYVFVRSSLWRLDVSEVRALLKVAKEHPNPSAQPEKYSSPSDPKPFSQKAEVSSSLAVNSSPLLPPHPHGGAEVTVAVYDATAPTPTQPNTQVDPAAISDVCGVDMVPKSLSEKASEDERQSSPDPNDRKVGTLPYRSLLLELEPVDAEAVADHTCNVKKYSVLRIWHDREEIEEMRASYQEDRQKSIDAIKKGILKKTAEEGKHKKVVASTA